MSWHLLDVQLQIGLAGSGLLTVYSFSNRCLFAVHACRLSLTEALGPIPARRCAVWTQHTRRTARCASRHQLSEQRRNSRSASLPSSQNYSCLSDRSDHCVRAGTQKNCLLCLCTMKFACDSLPVLHVRVRTFFESQLVGEPGKKNGEKLLRTLITATPEWCGYSPCTFVSLSACPVKIC